MYSLARAGTHCGGSSSSSSGSSSTDIAA
jgi:hypothetical protein